MTTTIPEPNDVCVSWTWQFELFAVPTNPIVCTAVVLTLIVLGTVTSKIIQPTVKTNPDDTVKKAVTGQQSVLQQHQQQYEQELLLATDHVIADQLAHRALDPIPVVDHTMTTTIKKNKTPEEGKEWLENPNTNVVRIAVTTRSCNLPRHGWKCPTLRLKDVNAQVDIMEPVQTHVLNYRRKMWEAQVAFSLSESKKYQAVVTIIDGARVVSFSPKASVRVFNGHGEGQDGYTDSQTDVDFWTWRGDMTPMMREEDNDSDSDSDSDTDTSSSDEDDDSSDSESEDELVPGADQPALVEESDYASSDESE